MVRETIRHPLGPVFDSRSRVLILGTMPSPASRAGDFYYLHPQNRFWRVVSTVLGCECPRTVEEKQQMLHTHHIALWDTIASCEISGSSDSSIREAVPTDLMPILQNAPIRQIFCNGTASYQLYCRHQQMRTGRTAVKLPSTSPANAAWSVARLTQAWMVILDALK